MKQRYALSVRGKHKSWSFPLWAEPGHVAGWRADGLNVTDLIYSVPVWFQRIIVLLRAEGIVTAVASWLWKRGL